MLYTSVDQPVAAPIVAEFEKQTGIHVVLVTDTEATKSVGLAEKLRAEKANPQADVWWSNEIFHTINLADENVLSAYFSPAADEIPAQFKDPDARWTGNGYRVRVLVEWNGKHSQMPRMFGQVQGLEDLTDPSLKSSIGMARPTAGTTGGHVAALYVLWGDAKADRFFHALHDNDVKLLGGNSVVADSVGKKALLEGMTDNDDAQASLSEHGELRVLLPDQKTFGTLVIPTTVGLVNGAPHSNNGKLLVDFLLCRQAEQKMIDAKFAYGSLRGGVGQNVKAMDVDYRVVAQKMPQAVRRATAILEGRE